jgi:hypothetical protein
LSRHGVEATIPSLGDILVEGSAGCEYEHEYEQEQKNPPD